MREGVRVGAGGDEARSGIDGVDGLAESQRARRKLIERRITEIPVAP